VFNAVCDRWQQEPAATRSKLVVFGESLGLFGSEHAFNRGGAKASVARVTTETDGALWVGPTYSNPIRTPLVRARDSGSPTWRPKIGNGDTVTFTNSPSELLAVDGQPVVYLQHPSESVGWWDWSAAYEKPLWLQGPRRYDVPKRAHWFPFVTWAQTSTDPTPNRPRVPRIWVPLAQGWCPSNPWIMWDGLVMSMVEAGMPSRPPGLASASHCDPAPGGAGEWSPR
jgi:uncharacterized membrane protein